MGDIKKTIGGFLIIGVICNIGDMLSGLANNRPDEFLLGLLFFAIGIWLLASK